jgi:hypothetical protein
MNIFSFQINCIRCQFKLKVSKFFWVFVMCWNEDRTLSVELQCFFWSIWHHWNDIVWDDSSSLPNQVGRIAYDAWNDWFVVYHMKNEEDYYYALPTSSKWEKPRIDWMGKMYRWFCFFYESKGKSDGSLFSGSCW